MHSALDESPTKRIQCPPCAAGVNPTVNPSGRADVYMSLVLYPRMLHTRFLARLRKPTTFEFAFGLEPIVQLTPWLFAAFEIDFVCATSDFLVTRRALAKSLPSLPLGWGSRGALLFHFSSVSMTYSSPFFVVTRLLGEGQVRLAPPSTRMVCPFMYAPSSENRNATIAAMSSAAPSRGERTEASICLRYSSVVLSYAALVKVNRVPEGCSAPRACHRGWRYAG